MENQEHLNKRLL